MRILCLDAGTGRCIALNREQPVTDDLAADRTFDPQVVFSFEVTVE
ncbi:MAG: hypothetical protein IPF51_18050 [Dehalococcoidia bacterium]|nr:hypothetical protein [Dehalococcoidia bacterium]